MAEIVDLKSIQCGFESHRGHDQKERVRMKKIKRLAHVFDRQNVKRVPPEEYKDAIGTMTNQAEWNRNEVRLAIELPDGTLLFFGDYKCSFPKKVALSRFFKARLVHVPGVLTWTPIYEEDESDEQ